MVFIAYPKSDSTINRSDSRSDFWNEKSDLIIGGTEFLHRYINFTHILPQYHKKVLSIFITRIVSIIQTLLTRYKYNWEYLEFATQEYD